MVAQNVIVFHNVSRCLKMWLCLIMAHDVSKCLMVSHGGSWYLKISHGVSKCVNVSQNVSWCLMVARDVSKCLMVSHDGSWCLKMSHGGSWCLKMSHGVSKCFMMCHNVVSHGHGIVENVEERNTGTTEYPRKWKCFELCRHGILYSCPTARTKEHRDPGNPCW